MRFYISAALALLCAGGAAAAYTPHRYGLVGADGRLEGNPVLDLRGVSVLFYCPSGPAACGKALEDISKDHAARAVLLTRAFFLAGPGDQAGTAGWNSGSVYEYSAAYDAADWPELAGAAGPRILFFNGGAQACAVNGWRGATGREEFRTCMRKAGLLTPAARLETAAMLPWSFLRAAAAGAARDTASAECSALLKEGAFRPETVPGYDTGTLKRAYDLVSYFDLYTPRPDMLAAQARLLAELKKRGLATEMKVLDLHKSLINARQFSGAAELKALYPQYALQTVPPVTGSTVTKTGETALYYTKDGVTSMQVEKVPAAASRVVIAAFPDCHPAAAALKEIAGDKELGPLFEKHALLLTSRPDFEALGEWNASHKLQYRITAADGDWPGVDFDHSPGFYFMRNGMIVHSIPGWADEGFLDSVAEGLVKAFPGIKLKRRRAAAAAADKPEPVYRRIEPVTLGSLLKGLNPAQAREFCASVRFSSGAFSGAELAAARAVIGGARADRLRGFFSWGQAASADGGFTLGELWGKLDEEQFLRTCASIRTVNGAYAGVNLKYILDVYGEKGAEATSAFFSRPDGN
jgi:hypothetical protein